MNANAMYKNEMIGTFYGAIYNSTFFRHFQDSSDEDEISEEKEKEKHEEEEEINVKQPETADAVKEEKIEEVKETPIIKEPEIPRNDENEKNANLRINETKQVDFAPKQPVSARNMRGRMSINAKRSIATSSGKRTDIFEQKLKETNEAMAKFLSDFAASEEAIDKKLSVSFRNLVNTQKEELKNHDYEWKYGAMAKFYSRESQGLKVLKDQYKSMLKMGLNEEAEITRKSILKLEAEEKKENQKNLTTSFLHSRARLEKKQAEERKKMRENANYKKTMFQAKKNQNNEILEKRQRILIRAKINSARDFHTNDQTYSRLPRFNAHN